MQEINDDEVIAEIDNINRITSQDPDGVPWGHLGILRVLDTIRTRILGGEHATDNDLQTITEIMMDLEMFVESSEFNTGGRDSEIQNWVERTYNRLAQLGEDHNVYRSNDQGLESQLSRLAWWYYTRTGNESFLQRGPRGIDRLRSTINDEIFEMFGRLEH